MLEEITFIRKKLQKLEFELRNENPYYIRHEGCTGYSIKIPNKYLLDDEKDAQFLYEILLDSEDPKSFEIGHADGRITDASMTYHVWLKEDDTLFNSIEGELYRKSMKHWEATIEGELRSRGITRTKLVKVLNSFILRSQTNDEPSTFMSHVYLINIVGTEMYKIGVSDNPRNRLQTLQTGSPFDLEISFTRPTNAPYKVENSLHKLFSDYQLKNEWFSLSDEQVEVIKTINLNDVVCSDAC